MKFIEFTSVLHSQTSIDEYEMECARIMDKAESLGIEGILPDMPTFYTSSISIDPDTIAVFHASFSYEDIKNDRDNPDMSCTTVILKCGEYITLADLYKDVKEKINAHYMAL